VYLSDAMLAPLGAALRAATGVPVVATVHGLDLTWENRAYQAAVRRSLRRLDLVMPNSRATEQALRERTGARPPSEVIPLGVNALATPSDADRAEFRRLAGAPHEQRVVLTAGRLIERKGAAWFTRNVLPRLPEDVVYVVVGEGPDRGAIASAASHAGVSHRVRLTGRISDGALAAAYHAADLFVMPNVSVPGDMEGFGLVALEASGAGVPVVASRIDGITEAVHHERNGLLAPPGDAEEWARVVCGLLALPPAQLGALGDEFARHTRATFGWDRTARRYVQAMERALGRQSRRVLAKAA
jgi:glycosyltransferase involved in cell wall biosynthesis